ncbi:hypothetical protein DCAR_0832314 [Daucus carota subsp. sativus]|uniref:Protein kinase domain-containing protein n=1 Tax=Daucus carota subsp. sativus TaxID=79200 RepID=A0A175YPF7_DAUCS|nr:PREDICTED: serine/threonine-protein kinase STY8 [Daucus carota subsp. sativus]WOH12806.1 hypothetical protein DCAR_0832314 [Daucus carota subsp. sativus]
MEKNREEEGEVKKIEYGDVALGFNLIRARAKLSQKDTWGRATRSLSGKEMMIFRADRVDLKNLDVQLEKHLKTLPSINLKPYMPLPKEDWELDLSKLEIRYYKAHGSFGTVYRGTYDETDVAVKLLDWGEDGKATSSKTAALRAAFRQEISVWHKLDHPNVTKFVGAALGTSDIKIPAESSTTKEPPSLPAKACCVVVEFLRGGTLKELLYRNRKKKLPFKTVVQLALDLARGLSYLHSNNIVHRDVKAENMLLDAQRNLKIADFGLARVEALYPEDMTGETGTIVYMAPEVIDGQPYNRKCDVYSFAICLWEIYCCDRPYPNLCSADVSYQVVEEDLRPKIPKRCPSPLASIMRKCWDEDPEKRPSMDEAVRMLEALDTSEDGGMTPKGRTTGCFCFAPARGH